MEQTKAKITEPTLLMSTSVKEDAEFQPGIPTGEDREYSIRATFTEFDLPNLPVSNDSAIVPTVKGSVFLRSGKHVYYVYDFRARKCLRIEISHRDIIAPGMTVFLQSLGRKNTLGTKFNLMRERFHYGFTFTQQIMLMTVPHSITALGGDRFWVNLWSYVGYLEIDCAARTLKYLRRAGQEETAVLGSQQWVSRCSGDVYYITYSLPESLKKKADVRHSVSCKIIKESPASRAATVVWSGELSDYLHDISVNKTEQYCVVCEHGMFQDELNQALPSKVLILDMRSGRHWIIEEFIAAAHAQFDPVEPDVIYFSQHNFKYVPRPFLQWFRAARALEFVGPASVYKYRLTSDGPVRLGIFTDPELFRLTNFHVFMHRGERVIAAMGFPDFIYIASADTLQVIRKITIQDKMPWRHLFRKSPCSIETFSPSTDGESLYVQTARSFQVVRVADGTPMGVVPLSGHHMARNHMQTIRR